MAAAPWSHDPPSLRARLMEALGGVCWWQGDIEAMRAPYGEAVELWRADGDRRELANALYNYSFCFSFAIVQGGKPGDTDADRIASAALEEALALYREAGDEEGEANVLWGMGNNRYFGGRPGSRCRRVRRRARHPPATGQPDDGGLVAAHARPRAAPHGRPRRGPGVVPRGHGAVPRIGRHRGHDPGDRRLRVARRGRRRRRSGRAPLGRRAHPDRHHRDGPRPVRRRGLRPPPAADGAGDARRCRGGAARGGGRDHDRRRGRCLCARGRWSPRGPADGGRGRTSLRAGPRHRARPSARPGAARTSSRPRRPRTGRRRPPSPGGTTPSTPRAPHPRRRVRAPGPDG